MAGSRLDRIGTIFSRTAGLLRSGTMKYQDRPVWYDVYRVFPPKYEPLYDREPQRTTDIPFIFYKEDKPRAEFFKRFGHNPGGDIRNLNDRTYEESSQIFVKQFLELEKSHPEWTFEQTFNSTVEAYQMSRPNLTRSRRPTSSVRDEYPDEDTFEEQKISKFSSQQDRKPKIITAESLRSLFEEAKEKQNSEVKIESTDSKDK